MYGNCKNHPETKAVNVCHECGDNYCLECLTEGSEYYYCAKPACMEALKKEELMPEELICPNCSCHITLTFEERSTQKIHCPKCEALLDYKSKEDRIVEPDEFVEIISSFNQGDLAVIKSLLDDAQIEYNTIGENFLSVDPLIQPAKIYVKKAQLLEAHELLKEFKLHIFGASADNVEETEE